MKEKIIEIYNTYIEKNPHLTNEKTIVLLVEGLGDYKGKPKKQANELHQLGRMGAELAIFEDGELVYSTKNASTLPDIPMDIYGKFNSGSPTPTTCVGIYDLYTKIHGKNKVDAFELGRGNETIPVIRNNKQYIEYESVSNGIDLHNRTIDDSETYACSTGCENVLNEDFVKVVEILGKYKNSKYIEGVYVGKIIIDRSQIPEVLQRRYKKRYGKYYTKCFNTDMKLVDTSLQVPQWQVDSFYGLIEKNIIQSPKYWQDKLGQFISVGEVFTVLNKMIKN